MTRFQCHHFLVPHPSSTPPPLPSQKKTNVGLWIAAAFGLLILISLSVGATVAIHGFQKKQAAKREALAQMEKEAAAAREYTATSLEKGDLAPGQEDRARYMGRMKDALEKSATHLTGDEAAATRAIAAFLARMQEHVQTYETASARILEAKVLSFEITDRATIAQHRQLLGEFSAANEKLTDILHHSEDLVRKELAAAKVSDRMVETTMTGFNRSRAQRQLQLRIRESDRVLGETGLAALDLLEKNWGQWNRDTASGQLLFQNDATLASFNVLMAKIQTAADEQGKAQQELAAKIRAAGK
jgi:hypothetical protein